MIRATRRVNPPEPYNHLDAYELPDCPELPGGGIALSSRGAVMALNGGYGKDAAIHRYARGMLKEKGRSKLNFVEFITPDGGSVCRGILLEEFVEIVKWYAMSHALGELHPKQIEIGRACALMQAVAADIGWKALALSWFDRALPLSDIPIIQAAALMRERTRWEQFYPWGLAEVCSKFVNIELPLDRKLGWPAFMAPFHRALHVVLLGKDMAIEARQVRDETGNHTIHQCFNEELKEAIREKLPMLITMAEISDTKEEWIANVAKVVRRRVENGKPFSRPPKPMPGQTSLFDLFDRITESCHA